MTNHERLREQYEDALFALLMEGVAESEGEEALRLNEELKKDPNAEVPKDVQKRCEKTIRSAFARKQFRTTGRTAIRWLTSVAVVADLGGGHVHGSLCSFGRCESCHAKCTDSSDG